MPDEKRLKASGPITIDALVDISSPAEPALSPDGSQIAFVQQVGDTRHVYSIPSSGGWPVRLTAGERSSATPRWSPNGRQLAYVTGKAIFVAEADGANPKSLTEHPAGDTMPRWSPDGTQIAFYSRRRGWSQIWVVAASGGTPRRLTAAAEDNDDLQWSPDGLQIAYSSIRGGDLNSRSIFAVEVATGVERLLTGTPGSYEGAPSWSPSGDRIAFLSDLDGWIHLYLMRPDGSERHQLSVGECDDGWPTLARGHVHWSPDGRRLAFVRNRGGMLDPMILDITSGRIQQIPVRDGFYQPADWTADGAGLICLASRPDAPADIVRLGLDGAAIPITSSLAGGLRNENFVSPARVSYRARDGLSIQGFLYRPRSANSEQRCPAIVHAHGGPTYQSYYSWPDPMVQLFVQEGYAVFEPDFRGSSGYGRDFRLANVGDWGVGDANDCIDAAGFLRSLEWVDGDRIGIWGGSYGGYLVLCCLTESPETFRAGIDLFGDSEIAESFRHGDRLSRLDLQRQMGLPEDDGDAFRRGSPVYRAERMQSPLLILHGRDDTRVVPMMSERMLEALTIEGKFVESQFYEGEGHGFRKPATRRDAYQRMLAFFERHLKGFA